MKVLSATFFLVVFLFLGSDYAFAKGRPILFTGKIALIDSELSARYWLLKGNDGKYLLKIGPKSAQNSCLFNVKRISLPHGMSRIKGSVFSNRLPKCSFNISDTEKKIFWNKVILIDLVYSLTGEDEFGGQARINHLDSSYQAHLIFSK